MERVLMIVSALCFVAFVVGMFRPKAVKCRNRGMVVAVYIGLFIVSRIVAAVI